MYVSGSPVSLNLGIQITHRIEEIVQANNITVESVDDGHYSQSHKEVELIQMKMNTLPKLLYLIISRTFFCKLLKTSFLDLRNY